MTEIDTQVQEAQRIPNKLYPKRNTPRHIIIEMSKDTDKERIFSFFFYKGLKTVYSINGIGKISYMQKDEARPSSYNTNKNKFKMD